MDFYRAVSFRTLLGLGSMRLGPTYRSLYDRGWVHRGPTLKRWLWEDRIGRAF